MLLPLLAVELLPNRHRIHGSGVETACVHAESVGVGARDIESLDSAARAEQVIGRLRIEAIAS